MKLIHKTFLNKSKGQYDLTIENGQINENVHRGGYLGWVILADAIAKLLDFRKVNDSSGY